MANRTFDSSHCILAPIPAADFAKNSDKLVLVPDLSISSKESWQCSTLWREEHLRYAIDSSPSDSATSVTLLKFLVKHRNLTPDYVEMGPDLNGMLANVTVVFLLGIEH